MADPSEQQVTEEVTLEELDPYFDLSDEEVLEKRFAGPIREKWRTRTEEEMFMEGVRQFRIIKM